MESNREEGVRCLRLAEAAYRSLGDLEKSKRLANKSIRLFPSEEAKGKERRERERERYKVKRRMVGEGRAGAPKNRGQIQLFRTIYDDPLLYYEPILLL